MEFKLNNRNIITELINSEVSKAAKNFSSLRLWISTKKEIKNDNEKQDIEIFAIK